MRMRHGLALFLFALFLSACSSMGVTEAPPMVAAGGLTNFAASDRAELYRKQGDGTQTYKVSLDRILNHGDLSTNFAVAPGDVITVPERLL